MQAGYLRRCQQGASTPFRAGCSTWARLNLKLCPKHSIEPVTGLRSKASVEVVVVVVVVVYGVNEFNTLRNIGLIVAGISVQTTAKIPTINPQ